MAQAPVQAAVGTAGDTAGEDAGMPDASVPATGVAPMGPAGSQDVQSSDKEQCKRRREQGKFAKY